MSAVCIELAGRRVRTKRLVPLVGLSVGLGVLDLLLRHRISAFWLVAVAYPVLVIRERRRPLSKVTLESDRLVLEDPWFQTPIVVERDRVHSIRVGEFRVMMRGRSDQVIDPDLLIGWRVACLQDPHDIANLLLVLVPAVELPPASSRFVRLARGRSVPSVAITLRATDLRAADNALREWAPYKVVDHLPADARAYVLQRAEPKSPTP